MAKTKCDKMISGAAFGQSAKNEVSKDSCIDSLHKECYSICMKQIVDLSDKSELNVRKCSV